MVRKISKEVLNVGDIVVLRNGKACILTPCVSETSVKELTLVGRDEPDNNLYLELSRYDDNLLFIADCNKDGRDYDVMTIIQGQYYIWKDFFTTGMEFNYNRLFSTIPEYYFIHRKEEYKYTIGCRILYNFSKDEHSNQISSDTATLEYSGNELLKLMNKLPEKVNECVKKYSLQAGEATVEVDIEKDSEYLDRDEYDGHITPDGWFEVEG